MGWGLVGTVGVRCLGGLGWLVGHHQKKSDETFEGSKFEQNIKKQLDFKYDLVT